MIVDIQPCLPLKASPLRQFVVLALIFLLSFFCLSPLPPALPISRHYKYHLALLSNRDCKHLSGIMIPFACIIFAQSIRGLSGEETN